MIADLCAWVLRLFGVRANVADAAGNLVEAIETKPGTIPVSTVGDAPAQPEGR